MLELQVKDRAEITAQHVLVVGVGKSGQATARFLLEHAQLIGMTSLTLVDSAKSDALTAFAAQLKEQGNSCSQAEIKIAFGVEQVPDAHYDLCIITPGLAPHTALSKSAYAAADEVVSEIELAYRLSPPGLTWIAITGTNGKTTTTELLREVIKAGEGVQSTQVYSVGNIGTPALEALSLARAGDYFVAEVSSFQAARLINFKPQVAVLLNLSADHLDWHKDIKQYAADKCEIFARCGLGDLVLAPDESQLHEDARPVIAAALDAARSRGAEVQIIQTKNAALPFDADDMNMKGKHNISNACFALAVARYFDLVNDKSIQALKNFRPQPHRMQELGRYGNVLYVNDSKSTNADASIQALTAYAGLELILLLGGQSKGADYHDLAKAALARAKTILLFGEAAPELRLSFDALVSEQTKGQQVFSFDKMKDAVRFACENACPQEVVLLSPANASYDEFGNYKERGEYFTALVKSISEDGSKPTTPSLVDMALLRSDFDPSSGKESTSHDC